MKIEEITQKERDNNIINRWGKTHIITKRTGTKVNLQELKDGESVCYGDGKTFVYLLTEKKISK